MRIGRDPGPSRCFGFHQHLRQFLGADFVGFGQHQPVAHGGFVEHFHHVGIDLFHAMARIDQHQRAFQGHAPAQEVANQAFPLLDHFGRRLGEAIAGHVDQPQPDRQADVEEVQFLRAARRDRSARDRLAAGQRVEQRRFADVGAAGEGHFGKVGIGQEFQRGGGFQELDPAGEQPPGFLGQRGADQSLVGFGLDAHFLVSRAATRSISSWSLLACAFNTGCRL